MRNLFKRIKQWYRKNHQYANFKFMLFYAAWLPFMLAVMLLSGHTSFDSWVIFVLNVCIGLGFAKDWRIEANMHEYSEIVSDEVKHLFELHESEAKAVKRWQDRCISANRRRRRAERRLKRYIKALSHESDMRLKFECMVYEYEQMLLIARHAILDNNQLARDRFLAFMQEHPDIEIRVASREYVEGIQECIFMGDAKPSCFDGFMPLLQESENDYKQKAEEVLLTVPLATVVRVTPPENDDRGVIEQLQAIASDALYIGHFDREEKDISDMVGKTFSQVIANEDSLIFANDTEAYLFFHIQDCCESVTIDDICGELSDLAGTPLVKAEEVSDSFDSDPKEEYDGSYTWTFYKFATAKGYVDVRWYGTSNGYYSESVDLRHFPIKDGKLIRKE